MDLEATNNSLWVESTHTLFYPLREDMDFLTKIRIGRSLTQAIDGYLETLWGSASEGHPDKNQYVLAVRSLDQVPNSKVSEIAGLMHDDWKGFLIEAKDASARAMVAKSVLETNPQADVTSLTLEDMARTYPDQFEHAQAEYFRALGAAEDAVRGEGQGFMSDCLDVHNISKSFKHIELFHLYFTTIIDHMQRTTQRLSEQSDLSDPQTTFQAYNIASADLFRKLADTEYAATLNPVGWFGVTSYGHPQAIVETALRTGSVLFCSEDFEGRLKYDIDSAKDARAQERRTTPIVYSSPALGVDKVITPDQWMLENFDEPPPGHITYHANFPGAVLVMNAVARRYAEKIEVADFVMPTQQATLSNPTRMISP